jgi:glutathione S-transferase
MHQRIWAKHDLALFYQILSFTPLPKQRWRDNNAPHSNQRCSSVAMQLPPRPMLFVGNRNYSSWSLRAWLILRWAEVEFDETMLDLDQEGYGERRIDAVMAASPSGTVPALRVGTDTVWDTIGIAHWALDQPHGNSLLPRDPWLRYAMWSAIGEIHSGFASLRQALPMNLQRRCNAYGLSENTRREIRRIESMWRSLLQCAANSGGYLLGERSLLDAFALPIATRFQSYSISLETNAQQYVDRLLNDEDFLAWKQTARAEGKTRFSRALIDDLYL